MPKRTWTRPEYLALMEHAKGCDGDICLLCLKIRFSPKERTLDHLDNDKRNHDPANIHILCRGCNVAENNRLRAGKPRLLTAETLPQYLAHARAHLAKINAPVSQVPISLSAPAQVPPMKSNRRKFRGMSRLKISGYLIPLYLWWLFQWVSSNGSISKKDAVIGGAFYLVETIGRGHPKTVEPYFDMVSGCTGWLVEENDTQGQPVFKFREGYPLENLKRKLEVDVEGLGVL